MKERSPTIVSIFAPLSCCLRGFASRLHFYALSPFGVNLISSRGFVQGKGGLRVVFVCCTVRLTVCAAQQAAHARWHSPRRCRSEGGGKGNPRCCQPSPMNNQLRGSSACLYRALTGVSCIAGVEFPVPETGPKGCERLRDRYEICCYQSNTLKARPAA